MSERARIIELHEYEPLRLPKHRLSREMARRIQREHGKQVAVEWLWQEGDVWQLTSQGWVGHIPVDEALHLSLQPKVSIESLFYMLEYAYRVGEFLQGEVHVESLRDLYERLAHVLAKRVLDRARQGLYRTYISCDDRTPYVRGRMDVARMARAPWETRIPCRYQVHTPDIDDNQILAWTLLIIARSGICTERALPSVRRAFRQVAPYVSLQPQEAAACVGRLYHRLNEDYRPLHALCRFFLENSSPAHPRGDRSMLPFMINMAQLFEVFVAAWLDAHPVPGLRFNAHERFVWDAEHDLQGDIDLLLRDGDTGQPVCVLDTKYKRGATPSHADVYQIVFYALRMGCHEAVLIYPEPLASPVDAYIRDIRVRTLCFDLSRDLDEAGQAFVRALLGRPAVARPLDHTMSSTS